MTELEEYTERSFAVRWTMWKATAKMIADHPLTGVGAGAWQVEIPRYYSDEQQLEVDYYAHNEPLLCSATFSELHGGHGDWTRQPRRKRAHVVGFSSWLWPVSLSLAMPASLGIWRVRALCLPRHLESWEPPTRGWGGKRGILH